MVAMVDYNLWPILEEKISKTIVMVKTYISFVVTIYVIATHILFSYARDPFEEYYKCIEKKNRQFDKIKDQLEAHLLYQGQNIHISCHLW